MLGGGKKGGKVLGSSVCSFWSCSCEGLISRGRGGCRTQNSVCVCVCVCPGLSRGFVQLIPALQQEKSVQEGRGLRNVEFFRELGGQRFLKIKGFLESFSHLTLCLRPQSRVPLGSVDFLFPVRFGKVSVLKGCWLGIFFFAPKACPAFPRAGIQPDGAAKETFKLSDIP